MNKLLSSFILLSAVSIPGWAGNHIIEKFQLAGPVSIQRPAMIDSVDIYGNAFDERSLLAAPVSTEGSKLFSSGEKLVSPAPLAVASLSFDVQTTAYTTAALTVSGIKTNKIYVDGTETDGKNLALEPGTHHFVISSLLKGHEVAKPKVTLSTDNDAAVTVLQQSAKRLYDIKDVLNGTRLWGASLSHDGRYCIEGHNDTQDGGKQVSTWIVRDLNGNKVIRTSTSYLRFYPGSDDLLMDRTGDNGKRQIVRIAIDNGKETVIADGLPKDDSWLITPDGKSLILTHVNEGPKEDKDIYQIVDPDDRQPGWRNRTSLLRYDLSTGVTQPLTFGYKNVSLLDISSDSRCILFLTSRRRLTARPTTLSSIWRMDLQTLKAECLVKDDGFILSALFSPDGKQLAIEGSPECLGGIGKNLPEGRIPSMEDNQLYLFDIDTKEVKPLTKDFDPCINRYVWSKEDGTIWITALDKDYCHLFKCDPKTDIITRIPHTEDVVFSVSPADNAKKILWYGESVSNTDRLYTLDTTTGTSTLIEDPNTERMKDIELGDCEPWSFVNSRGDTIWCRYYLPPHFDKSKKYPVIVNYYGGCSPTSRYLESRYPHHVYAAAGYVVLVVNPSGAVGFGREFASRHVNTAGKGVAEDIIEATKTFCKEHSYTDTLHIGCIGASYGGFMTQYLQTQTNIFAAAISHAGISDHTSYWGEGYWGYSYSEVSMAGSYPWTRKDLYVDQSPLFNAEKIHTPLLFLHGSADHNVPIGESIQMFTALVNFSDVPPLSLSWMARITTSPTTTNVSSGTTPSWLGSNVTSRAMPRGGMHCIKR